MRIYAVTLAANTNSSTTGATLDVTGAAYEIGAWSREVEKELTKISPSEQVVKLKDLDGSIWAWIKSQIQITGTDAAVYPPWVLIDLDGTRAFTGFAYTRQITRDERTGEITITAQDWSSGLKSRYLGADNADDDLDPTMNPWLRPYPKAATGRGATSQVCYNLGYYPNPVQNDQVYWTSTETFVEAGDYVTCDLSTQHAGFPVGKQYKVSSVARVSGTNAWHAIFDGLGKDLHDYTQFLLTDQPGTFTRVAQSTDLRDYFLVTKDVASDATDVYSISLDVVDGIAAGDVLTTVDTTSIKTFTVLQVDAEALQVVVKDSVTGLTANSTRLFYDTSTLQDLVLDDARSAIKRAVTLTLSGAVPYGVDFSRYTPPTVENPVLVWLPLRPMGSQDLSTIRDMDQSLTAIRLYGAGTAAWTGTPEVGWTASTDTTLRAPWSSQLVAAPAYSMPDETLTLAPTAPKRNAALWTIVRTLTGWDPQTLSVPDVTVVYDYLKMRRVIIRKDMSVQVNPWTGAAWGASTAYTWPGANPVLSASVFPAVPGAILGLTSAGLMLVSAAAATLAILAIPTDAADSVLRTTPWGCYLVGPQGYGLITYASGALTLNWVTLSSGLTSFYPNTFQGLNSTELMMIARFDGTDSSGDTVTETHLLRLAATPAAQAQDSILSTEKILDGAPRTVGAMRDGTQSERIIGHCGGRQFVFGRTLPASYAIERYTPSGLKALELVEHICQVLNCMAVPDPFGCLHIISRGIAETPVDLTVDRVDSTETRVWDHFYSVVRVSSAKDDSVLADSWGQSGGDVLEYSQHPLIWTQSGCNAVSSSLASWFGVPRRYREETWFWTNPDVAAPWESLGPVATVRVNGDTTRWIVLGIDDDRVNGEANVKLVEVF